MNDTNPNPDGVTPDKSAGRRKRAAPTIDLEAKEIPPAGTPEAAVPEATAESVADAPMEPPVDSDAPGSVPPADAPPPPPEQNGLLKPLVIGGIAGAAAATIVIAIGWSAGLFASEQTAAAPDPRVAALETQIKQLQSRPATPAANTGATDALAARIAKVEDSVGKM